MNDLRLYSASVCPFAQRTRMLLLQKQVDFELIEIDLDDPPAAFLRLSPHAKVPLLLDGDDRIWESAVINEYLEERFPEPALMPGAPLDRARVRIWVDYANNQFVPWFYKLLLEQDAERQTELAGRLLDRLKFMEQGLAESAGPYWIGASLTLADFAFYPFLERMCLLNHYRNFHIPASCPRLSAWIDQMRRLPAVKQTGHSVAFYIERYRRYADGSTQSDTAREMREL